MVSRIVIVGGGSAGWMTAAHLATHLPQVDITLMESSDIATVGIGESTLPPIVEFMNGLGLREVDWMPTCDATIKSATGFKDFHRVGEPKMWHPFEPIEVFKGCPLNRYWHHKHLTDPAFADRFTFYDYCHFVPALAEAGRTMASLPETRYAYHIDVGLLGDYLEKLAVGRGVIHVVDTLDGVNRSSDGTIISVGRKGGDALTAELFIDCTGFDSRLLGDGLNEPFDSYRAHLFNDRAVTLSLPYADKKTEMFSYTRCSARGSGWIWEIPLYSRIGTGYMYSSAHVSDEQAESDLRAFLGSERTAGSEAEVIHVRTGKHRRTWVNNCVALGLSAGFVEPLESTGIQTVQGPLELLTHTLRAGGGQYNAADRATYNHSVTQMFELIRDFLVTHYSLTSREDTPYWRDVKYTTKVSERLSEKLQRARVEMPDRETFVHFDEDGLAGFRFEDGWTNILVGMNHLPFRHDHLEHDEVGPFDPHLLTHLAEADAQYDKIRASKSKLSRLPSHYDFLRTTRYHGRP